MEKSVIKSHLILGFILFLFLNFQNAYPQDKYDLGLEKYSIINSAFKHSREQDIKIHKKTMPYETWMDEVWGEEFSNSHGVGFCLFENDQNLAKAFEDLRVSVKSLQVKKLSKKLIDDRFQIKRFTNSNNGLMLSEPIILGNYAFFFFRSKTNKSLYVSKINSDGIWDYECGVTIYGELH
ncbi:MAG: hypothetical protein HLUCCX10_06900 [Algoriphagus marincola HL-49]|uniref:Uncharacterized protein n=1 Tax=Algoriphagus marincola HL-49 TaxID=1305737 RepID=A0A0P8AG58_9BACT|nr:MAG: hypothetical protein HLUCCX10_06900 [Algoriphagus marincola HL-49]